MMTPEELERARRTRLAAYHARFHPGEPLPPEMSYGESAEGERLMPIIGALFSAVDAADDALDKETFEQMWRRDRLDLPDDAEVVITAGTQRKINRVFREIENLRRATTTKE